MANIYDLRRYGRIAFLISAAAVVALFLYFSNGLIKDLSAVERERMELWADATKELVSAASSADGSGTDVDFLLGIIKGNTTIPVLLTDSEGNILQHRNFELPVPGDTLGLGAPSDKRNAEFLATKLSELEASNKIIVIDI